jgi:capsid protein
MANLIDKMAKALGFSRMVEAANWRPEERAWVQSQAQDSKVDISNGDRVRLLGLSRKLFYNNAIVRSAIRDKATYSVGSAIAPQANSGDPAWDDAAEAWWDNWSKSPEISERHDMRRLQMLVSEAIDRDGEIFCILTNKRDGMPAVQVVESHRVANPPDKADQIIDGVSLDRFARPLAYHVVEGDTFSQRTSRSIQADLMLHVYEPERPDQVRGYPAVAVALNNLLDRDELLRFEMQAAKIGSSIGLVVQNAQGGAPIDIQSVRHTPAGVAHGHPDTTFSHPDLDDDVELPGSTDRILRISPTLSESVLEGVGDQLIQDEPQGHCHLDVHLDERRIDLESCLRCKSSPQRFGEGIGVFSEIDPRERFDAVQLLVNQGHRSDTEHALLEQ